MNVPLRAVDPVLKCKSFGGPKRPIVSILSQVYGHLQHDGVKVRIMLHSCAHEWSSAVEQGSEIYSSRLRFLAGLRSESSE